MIGTMLSHYRIDEKLGSGSLGVVYRAEDIKVHHLVALRVVPDEFVNDAERVSRFRHEAQVLASLSHPNIGALHGLEESDGTSYIVMELFKGETLAKRLRRGPLPVNEALEMCRGIAEGLDAAHERGVIHRDLRPANVMITSDDQVKILDFGLAKATPARLMAAVATQLPAVAEAVTSDESILSAAYKSPEQATGKAVDKRSDIWAFGCILYECLTGKSPFRGETVAATVEKILECAPDWSLLPPTTPWRTKDLLHLCLQRNPKDRLHDIGDARIEIGDSVPEPPQLYKPRRRFAGRRLLAFVAGPIIGALATVAWMRYSRPTPIPEVVRAYVKIETGGWLAGMGSQEEFWRPSRTSLVVSSDGRFIVYSATERDPSLVSVPRLHLRRTDQLEGNAIAGAEGGINPFLSPDDRWVGFWANGKLLKISVTGGVPATLCEVPQPFGASWGHDNNVVFSRWTEGLFSVSADSGVLRRLTEVDRTKDEAAHGLPHCLPGDKGALFTIVKEDQNTRPSVALLDLKTRKWRTLLEDGADARYVTTGHLVFLRRGALMAVAFDLSRLEVSGQPVPAISNVMQAINGTDSRHNTCAGQFGISDSGLMAYVSGGIVPDVENTLVWVDQAGTATPVAPFKAPVQTVRLSPDGKRIAYATMGSEWQLHVYDLALGRDSSLTVDGKNGRPAWTADGTRLVFTWWKAGQEGLCWKPADAGSPAETLLSSDNQLDPGSVTPDGSTLAFVATNPVTPSDILLLNLQNKLVTPFLNSNSNERCPAFSPDGRWLAYSSDESGREEVWVHSYPDPGGKWRLSLEGGTEPLWARNGKQLFYRWKDQVWAVDVKTDPVFSSGNPRLLFEQAGFKVSPRFRCWDVAADGRQFLMVRLDERKPPPLAELVLVLNWFEELRRLCPPAGTAGRPWYRP